MDISRAPVILEQQMSSFNKKSFINYDSTFIFHGYVKFSIWHIPNEYIEDSYVIVSVIVGYIFREVN